MTDMPIYTDAELRRMTTQFLGYGNKIGSAALHKIYQHIITHGFPDIATKHNGIVTRLYFGLTIFKDKGCWCKEGDWSIYQRVLFDGKQEGAHRLSYMIMRGPIVNNNIICHYCDRKGCRNPFHLHSGTDSINMHDWRNKKDLKNPELISINKRSFQWKELKHLREVQQWKKLSRFAGE